MLVSHLLQLPAERHAAIRAYTGHFPYVATRLLDMPLTTLSLLREPVARTISYLKHCKRYQPRHRDLALEAIYEDLFFYPTLIHNHQTKIFAMTEAVRRRGTPPGPSVPVCREPPSEDDFGTVTETDRPTLQGDRMLGGPEDHAVTACGSRDRAACPA
jgi:hypothetical protein